MPELMRVGATRAEEQIALMMHYKGIAGSGRDLPRISDIGFSVFSEADEDGILLYIFSLIGQQSRTLVDIGAARLAGSNTANLLVHHGWHGLLIDGDKRNVDRLARFYSACRHTRNHPPATVCSWVTKDNVNDLISSYGVSGEIDLLTIDIDGIDYWIWEAIECIQPRVVLVECQAIWGATRAVTVPYDPAFRPEYSGRFGIYSGASLPAFVTLGRRKGYRLIGAHRYGYNAFFLKEPLAQDLLPEMSAEECLTHPFVKEVRERFLNHIAHKEWIDV